MTDLHAPAPPVLSGDYTTARSAFLTAAEQAGASVSSTVHPRTGPAGEELALDVATLGPGDAAHRVLVVSATHGVEGFCGSALQTHWLNHFLGEQPDDVCVVMLHALNPYGFAWVRRVNEDNIDLNRNFLNWDEPAPKNPGYDELADLLVPQEWSESEQERTLLALMDHLNNVGFEKLQADVSQGQYDHPLGVFYGGSGKAWSNEQVSRVWVEELNGAERVTVIDLHTGLGPSGHGELISHELTGSPGYSRAEAMWGQVHSMVDGDSVSVPLVGDWLAMTEEWSGATEVVACALEFGTVDPITVLQALRADAWLHGYGDPLGPTAEEVRAQVRAAFADDDPAWIATCWNRFAGVISAALRT